MTLSFTSRPTDDWDPQGYEEEPNENLAALGMYTDDKKDKDPDQEDPDEGLDDPVATATAPIADDDEDEDDKEIDELADLDRLAGQLKDQELTMEEFDEDSSI